MKISEMKYIKPFEEFDKSFCVFYAHYDTEAVKNRFTSLLPFYERRRYTRNATT